MAKSTLTTPIGTAVYPHLTKPDEFKGSLKYKTNLRLTPKQTAEVRQWCLDYLRDNGSKVKKPQLPIKEIGDEETFEVIACSSKFAPLILDSAMNKVFDPKKQALSELAAMEIWGGSKVRLALSPFIYDKGMSFQLTAVQVIELVSGGGGYDTDGFSVVEDGFKASPKSKASTDSEDAEGLDEMDI